MTDSIKKGAQTLRDALKEVEGLAATDKQDLHQQAQKSQQALAYAQFEVQELRRARDDLVVQWNQETARADSLERQVKAFQETARTAALNKQVAALKTRGCRHQDWRQLLVKIAEVAGDRSPEDAVDGDFDPWDTLDGITRDKQRLFEDKHVLAGRLTTAEKTIQRLQAERTDILARNFKTWEEAQEARKTARAAQKERDAAVLSRAAAERQVADIKAEWDLVRAEVDKLREWKRSLPQSHWFIERQRLQDKVEDQAVHLEARRKDLEILVQQRASLQTEVAKVMDDLEKIKAQNDQLVQAILGLHQARWTHRPVGQVSSPDDIDEAWRACWQAVSAAGYTTPDDAVPAKSETAKAPVTKRASRSTRAKKPKG
jgi:chromosome segregation ATPase